MDKVALTEVQRAQLRRRCEEAILRTEKIIDDFEPASFVSEQILGKKGMWAFAVGWGTVSGVGSYLIWTAVFGWVGLPEILAKIGFPFWIASNIQVPLATLAAASAAAVPLVGSAREDRYNLMTAGQNAASRATILHSILEEVDQALPGTIPDLTNYMDDGYDGEPNALVERAIGRRGPASRRPQFRRIEPPLTRG